MRKRHISIGFIEPKKLEGDTIYVQLIGYESDPERVYAEAISKRNFKYHIIPKLGRSRDERGKKADSTFGNSLKGGHNRGAKFIKMLIDKNNAEVIEERFKEDGLALTVKLKGANKKLRKINMFMEEYP